MYLVGADIGGTFTDCVAVDDKGVVVQSKVLTTYEDFSLGITRGIGRLAETIGLDPRSLLTRSDRVSHGSTIGTNLMVEHRGAKTVLLTTRGHDDALLNMRGGHARVAGLSPELVYSLHTAGLPPPVLPRTRIWELDERIDSGGTIVVPLDRERARATVSEILASGPVEAVAVCFLWSFRNPVHEQAVAELLQDMVPDAYVSLSSDVAPRLGEYERAVATVINAIVGPGTSGYIDHCGELLHASGLRNPFLVMQSDGGVVAAEAAKRRPLRMLDSGPAGGVIGAQAVAEAEGHLNVITADMGGTSFDVSLLLGGVPVLTDEHVVDHHTFFASHIDVRSIACGGGTIARYERHARSLTVGPMSAGSDPGPACYRRGGTLPTVTDADVVLGFLNPENFLGGEMPLDVEAAAKALQPLADELGVTLEEAAAGVIRVNNNAAATLIRRRTLELGYDPRDFVIYAFGGSGPLHAYGFAGDLGISNVVIPMGNSAGTLSAGGIAMADVVARSEEECQLRSPIPPAELTTVLLRCVDRCRADLIRQGFVEAIEIDRAVQMRYPAQYMNVLSIPVPDGPVTEQVCRNLEDAFRAEYKRRYGSSAQLHEEIDVFAVQTAARFGAGTSALRVGYHSCESGEPGQGQVYWPTDMQWLSTRIYAQESLSPSLKVDGPALIELAHTTVAVPPGQVLTVTPSGSLLLSIG